MTNMNSYINDRVQLINIQINFLYLRLIVNKDFARLYSVLGSVSDCHKRRHKAVGKGHIHVMC